MSVSSSPVVFTAASVARATGGVVAQGAADRTFASVSIDSRTVSAGALYIAIRGERHDGHDFIPEAVAGGAAGVLVSTPRAVQTAAVIVVPDTVVALQQLARAIRRESGARVIAITGSTGKTTTKEVTATILSGRYRVFRNRGNLNNHIGLPLSLIELRDRPEVAVVELGMNHAGEIRSLVGIAEPDVRVWTNVGDAHIGHFGSQDAVADAKAEILEQASAATLLVANADDPFVRARTRAFVGRRRTFGESGDADVRATAVVDRGFDGTESDVATPAGRVRLRVPLAGRPHLSNVLAAVTVAVEFAVPLTSIEERVMSLRPVARRGSIATLAGGVRVIDDSYNASPSAVIAALRSFAATDARGGRRIAVLGEMLELGERSDALHRACGQVAAAVSVDELIAIGGAGADALVAGAIAAGLAPERTHHFASSADAAPFVAAQIRPRDLVFVKGSRATRTDLVCDRLQEVA